MMTLYPHCLASRSKHLPAEKSVEKLEAINGSDRVEFKESFEHT